MEIIMIAAHDNNWAIGNNNDLLWGPGTQRSDMQHFKNMTMGHPVIMGRKTWESIPKKYRPLEGRENIIITRDQDYGELVYDEFGTSACSSPEQALKYCREQYEGVPRPASDFSKVFIIGGTSIYEQFLGHATGLELTHVKHTYAEADAYFPPPDGFRLLQSEAIQADDRNKHAMSFDSYTR